jgi:hypothetical protein
MSLYMWIAFGCHLIATLGIGVFGLFYIFKRQFMSYHAAALGMNWAAVKVVNPKFQFLILALMKAVGGAALAVFVLEVILLFVPFWQGAIWARVAIPVGGIVASSGGLYATVYLLCKARPVPPSWTKKPPWFAAVLCIALFAAGLVLSLL